MAAAAPIELCPLEIRRRVLRPHGDIGVRNPAQQAAVGGPVDLVGVGQLRDRVAPGTHDRPEVPRQTSSPSEKHGWRVVGGMMGPVQ